MNDTQAPSQTNAAASADKAAADPMATRRAALQILTTVLDKGQPLDQALENSNAFLSLPEARDRAFVRMMVTTCLRRMGQIDDLIKRASARPDQPISPPLLQHILRLGITQIVFMDVPDHAAVNTTVTLTDENRLSRTKGFVNAMMRNIAGQGRDWTARQDIPRLNTPDWILQTLVKDYDLRTAIDILQCHIQEAPLDMTMRQPSQARDFAEHIDGTVLPNGTVRIARAQGRIEDMAGYTDGHWWVQDAAASLPAKLFGIVKDALIIDLCAAPGGKTAQLASAGAHVIALDRSARRLARFRENMKRLNLTDLVTTEAADASVWMPNVPADGVLLDAPCTASGTLRKRPDVAWLKTPADLATMVEQQKRLLENAAKLLKPTGCLVYSTCSLFKDEGERQIENFLKHHKDFARDPINASEIGGLTECISVVGDIRILPYHLKDQGGMDGFYAARLRRK
ncbi:MAG: RsmB/NOP family class I SAM-dependent RNA methyltransferase [Pseudobdellovibrionaceae bacterium]